MQAGARVCLGLDKALRVLQRELQCSICSSSPGIHFPKKRTSILRKEDPDPMYDHFTVLQAASQLCFDDHGIHVHVMSIPCHVHEHWQRYDETEP